MDLQTLNKQQLTRGAKISSGGNEISENLVDVIFALFDRAGDNCLSYEEFFVVIKNRLRRQVQYKSRPADAVRSDYRLLRQV